MSKNFLKSAIAVIVLAGGLSLAAPAMAEEQRANESRAEYEARMAEADARRAEADERREAARQRAEQAAEAAQQRAAAAAEAAQQRADAARDRDSTPQRPD